MKRILIISPYFPPTNAADMQRIRMSLPYFEKFGYTPEVVAVKLSRSDLTIDNLLLQTVPSNIPVYRVDAFDKNWTFKIGLGSIGLRSLYFFKTRVNRLLTKKKYDIIYFSTTQFPVCVLGAYWKRRFDIPYVIDMQDPWHSNYYRDKPKELQPPKYWFTYHLHKTLESIAMKKADGLISVSESYIRTLRERYQNIANIPSAVITFGAFEPDLEIAKENSEKFTDLLQNKGKCIVYVGRGGNDMHRSLSVCFEALSLAIREDPHIFKDFKFYFIGTSYAPSGTGSKTIQPLAETYGLKKYVVEITDRISYYHTLSTLLNANALFIPGSDDPAYTASKIYPYILTKKPLLAIFNKNSSAIPILKEYGATNVFDYGNVQISDIVKFFKNIANGGWNTVSYNTETLRKYAAQNMTLKQCILFNEVLDRKN